MKTCCDVLFAFNLVRRLDVWFRASRIDYKVVFGRSERVRGIIFALISEIETDAYRARQMRSTRRVKGWIRVRYVKGFG